MMDKVMNKWIVVGDEWKDGCKNDDKRMHAHKEGYIVV